MLLQITEREWLNTDFIKYIVVNDTKDSKITEICVYMVEGPSMAWTSAMLLHSVEKTFSMIKTAMDSKNVFILNQENDLLLG
jgi:hypothetical protein